MMHIGRENQRDAQDREKIRDHHALLVQRRIDRHAEAEAELIGDHRPGDQERGKRKPRREAEHRPDQDFLNEHAEERRKASIEHDRISVLVDRHQDEREHERDHETDARGNAALAQSRHQHRHGAEPREHQEKDCRERWQE
jgi:hypothetical protein